MKIYILLAIMFLSGCAQIAPTSDIESFFPLEENVLYVFDVEGLEEDGVRTVFNSYIRGNTAQRMIHASHFPPSTEVITVGGGEVTLVFGEPAHYTLEDITSANPNLDIVILQEPLELGHYWNNGDEHWEITSVSSLVETGAGSFETLQVTVTTASGNRDYYYYARGIGLVRSVHQGVLGNITISLAQRVEDSFANVPISVFFPNPYTAGIDAEARALFIPTNGDPAGLLNDEIHNPPGTGALSLLPVGVSIQYVNVYREQALAHVDLSPSIGSSYGDIGDGTIGNMLLGLTNTVGHMYDVAYVTFTMGGEALSWGPVQLQLGEAIAVDSLASLMELVEASG